MVLFEATALALVSVQTYRAFCFQVAKILWSAKLAAQVTLSELYHCHTHSTVQTYQAFCLQVAKILWSAKLALKLLSLNLALPYSFRCTVISGLLPPSGKNCLVSQAGCQVTLSEPCTAILIPLYRHIRPSASKWPRFFGQPSWLPSYSL